MAVHKQSKTLRTTEDWYPTIAGLILARLDRIPETDEWRVSLWGGDDFGLEQDFPPTEQAAAQQVYDALRDFVTQRELRARGFHSV